MQKWAQSLGQLDESHIRETMDNMQIADFEKQKMVLVFKCPPEEVADKIKAEFIAKKFPMEVVNAVTNGMTDITSYNKSDSHFGHASKASEKAKCNLYHYAVWCEKDTSGLMDVSISCIMSTFKKGSRGNTTKNELESLKKFMEKETGGDVLQFAGGRNARESNPSQDRTPVADMISYAKHVHKAHGQGSTLHQDELINKMEIMEFTKYKINVSFTCPRSKVTEKVKKELTAKDFPEDIIAAVTQGMESMHSCKKKDESFVVHAQDGSSTFHKHAIWCRADNDDNMMVSMMCIAVRFRKKSDGTATKSEIEVIGDYLGQEACVDVLKVHSPDVLLDSAYSA